MDEKEVLKPLPNTDTHNCFACSPINHSGLHMEFFTNDRSVFSWITVPDHLCGWNNLVHGGVLSTILDEIMSWAAIYLLKRVTMTKSMTVDFLKPVYIDHELKAAGVAHAAHGRRVHDADVGGRDDRQPLAQLRGDDRQRLPFGNRSSNGSKIAKIWPEFVEFAKPAPPMPAYTEADDTPGVPRMIGITCCTSASVRARLVPGGISTWIITSF